ncbi:MAG: hypothetical protein AAB392_00830 [Patescibacteria group bacterium]
MTKKILLIIGIVAVIAIAVFLILGEGKAGENGKVGFSFGDYFPFGNSEVDITLDTDQNSDENEVGTPINTGSNSLPPKLRKVSSEPIAGAVIYNSGTTSIVRWVERGTGNVYETDSKSSNIRRLTNTTIPKIIRAFWLPNGNGFLAQTLVPESEIIETSFVEITKNTGVATESLTPFTTRISKLPTGIKDMAIRKDSKKIFYFTTGLGASFYSANTDGTGSKLLASHPLSEWLVRHWLNDKEVLLQTKEGGGLPPYFSILNTGNGNLKRTENPMSQITTNIFTLFEKCILDDVKGGFVYCAVPEEVGKGTYPDDWYKGIVSTSDSVRKIDIENDVYYNTVDLKIESGEDIDVVDIKASLDQSHIIFKNKKDGFLWVLRAED